MQLFDRLFTGQRPRLVKDGVAAYQRGDYVEAERWFRLAAAQGIAVAQFNLGSMFATGQGVVQDYAEAEKWFRLAAAQGNADAQCSIGVMYFNGYGVAEDSAEAAKWYRLAAAQGNMDAQVRLGSMHDMGQVAAPEYPEVAESSSSAMNTHQRRILIVVAVFISGVMLYPPFHYPRESNSSGLRHGYAWLLNDGWGRVEIGLLLVQLLVVGVVGLIAYVLCADERK